MKEFLRVFMKFVCNPTLIIIFFGHVQNVVMLHETSLPDVPSNYFTSFRMKGLVYVLMM